MIEAELVLPCYNEAKSLEALVNRTVDAATRCGYTSSTFRLILVENGSRDNSRAVIKGLQQANRFGSWLKIVEIDQNQGYGFGLWSGLKATEAPLVAYSHADQQCDPEDVFKAFSLIKKSEETKILVKGIREGRSPRDRFVSRVFETFARFILGLTVFEINAQPKVFRRELLVSLKNPPKTFAFDLYLLYNAAKAGFRVRTLPVLFPSRIHGVSNWASTFLGRYRTILGMIGYMWELSRSEGRL